MSECTYRLVVVGELGNAALTAFPPMHGSADRGRTVLTGAVRDQAELQGLLQRVSDLGLVLVSVNQVESPD